MYWLVARCFGQRQFDVWRGLGLSVSAKGVLLPRLLLFSFYLVFSFGVAVPRARPSSGCLFEAMGTSNVQAQCFDASG